MKLIILTILILPQISLAGNSCNKDKDCDKTVYSGNIYAPHMQVYTGEKTVIREELEKPVEKVIVEQEKALVTNSKTENQNIQIVCAPQEKIVYKPKIIYKEKIVYKDRIVYRDREVEKLVQVVKEVPVNREVEVQVTKIVEKPVTKIVEQRVVEKKDPKLNSVSLIGVMAPTKLSLKGNSLGGATQVDAETDYEADFGLMYQRDVNYLRFSIGGTLKGIGVLGVGFNF